MTYQKQDTRWKGKEKIADGNNGQHVWCFRTMTGTRDNGKKTHGSGLFGMNQGEERWNHRVSTRRAAASWSQQMTEGVFWRQCQRYGGRSYSSWTKLESHCVRQVGCDILWKLDSEVGVEPDGDSVGARSTSQDTGYLHMDTRLSTTNLGYSLSWVQRGA
jgi:hypothetical protein